MSKDSAQLLAGIEKALQTLDDAELQLICLGVLHGLPISQLASAAMPQEKLQTTLIGGLKKLRKALTESGLSSAELQKQFKL